MVSGIFLLSACSCLIRVETAERKMWLCNWIHSEWPSAINWTANRADWFIDGTSIGLDRKKQAKRIDHKIVKHFMLLEFKVVKWSQSKNKNGIFLKLFIVYLRARESRRRKYNWILQNVNVSANIQLLIDWSHPKIKWGQNPNEINCNVRTT